jgi:hypothetical protein
VTTDPILHELETAAECLRHALRTRAAWHLRAARFAAGDFAWTVQELRSHWRTLKTIALGD